MDDLDGGSCSNSIGSYNCSCTAGFVGDGRTDQDGCDDYDECAAGEDNCSVDAECSNVPGTFECACKEGFTGNGLICEDIDECADEHACDPLAICSNRLGVDSKVESIKLYRYETPPEKSWFLRLLVYQWLL